jgi:hypothetical protein
MNPIIHEVLVIASALSTIAFGIYSKNEALVISGLAGLTGFAAVNKFISGAAGSAPAVETGLSIAQKILDSVAPQYSGIIDSSVKSVDDVLDALAVAKKVTPVAAGASAAAAATPSAVPPSPVAS